jgi:hypothetical protein
VDRILCARRDDLYPQACTALEIPEMALGPHGGDASSAAPVIAGARQQVTEALGDFRAGYDMKRFIHLR